MDYTNHSRADIKMPSPRISSADTGTGQTGQTKLDYTNKGHIKRSFDVAFLMLPDEKLKQKQHEKQQRLNADAVVTYSHSPQISVKSGDSLKQQQTSPNIDHPSMRYFHHQKLATSSSDELEIELINNNDHDIRVSRYMSNGTSPSNRSPRIYDDPSIHTTHAASRYNGDTDAPKSAFTKVPHQLRQESPIPPLSPDQLSCPSNSPPISASPPQHIIYQTFRPEYRFVNNGQFQAISQMQAQSQKFKQQFMYRPIHNGNGMDGSGYINAAAGFPFGPGGHPFAPQPDLTGIVRNPAAAALLTTLIPPTIATTFTLTAQNVCAKCNISFRMTSDLVYHMRSHHKSEFTSDTNRRKREEKLKCPVCNESFRERHHLTRHMTAHQDKASDEAETIQMQRRHK